MHCKEGKELFVLPGLLGDLHFEGNHQLIKQGANLASSPDDILEYLNSSLQWLTCEYESPQEQIDEKLIQLSDNKKRISKGSNLRQINN